MTRSTISPRLDTRQGTPCQLGYLKLEYRPGESLCAALHLHGVRVVEGRVIHRPGVLHHDAEVVVFADGGEFIQPGARLEHDAAICAAGWQRAGDERDHPVPGAPGADE